MEIPAGSSAEDIGAILAAQGVVRSALESRLLRNNEAAARLQAGTYEMETLMDPGEVVALLVVGPTEDVYRVTVIEGLRVPEIPHQTSAESSGLPAPTRRCHSSLVRCPLRSVRCLPPRPSPTGRGCSFPTPYEFAQSAEPVDILQRLSSTMEQRVDSIDWSAGRGCWHDSVPGTDHRLADRVRGPARRRTAHRLECDQQPAGARHEARSRCHGAVRHGHEGCRRVRSGVRFAVQHLSGRRAPPDTDLVPGTGLSEGGGRPAVTDYLFYVLSDLEGRHAFATTLEEHNANVEQARAEGVLPDWVAAWRTPGP